MTYCDLGFVSHPYQKAFFRLGQTQHRFLSCVLVLCKCEKEDVSKIKSAPALHDHCLTPLNAEHTQVFLLEGSGKLKQIKGWRPPWMRRTPYFNVGSRTSIPKTLQFADTSGSQTASSPAMTPRESYPLQWHLAWETVPGGQDKGSLSLPHSMLLLAGAMTLEGHLSQRPNRLVLALWWLFPCLGWLVSDIPFLKLSWKHEVRLDLTPTWHSHSLFTPEGTWVCYFTLSVLRL